MEFSVFFSLPQSPSQSKNPSHPLPLSVDKERCTFSLKMSEMHGTEMLQIWRELAHNKILRVLNVESEQNINRVLCVCFQVPVKVPVPIRVPQPYAVERVVKYPVRGRQNIWMWCMEFDKLNFQSNPELNSRREFEQILISPVTFSICRSTSAYWSPKTIPNQGRSSSPS